jgi:hypothetical protein
VRALPPPWAHPALVAAARRLDAGAVALDARPHVRAAILAYALALHLLLLRLLA